MRVPNVADVHVSDRATPRVLGWLVQAFLAVVALNGLRVTTEAGVASGLLRDASVAVVATVVSLATVAAWAAFAHTAHQAVADRIVRRRARRLALLAVLALLPVPVLGPEWLTWTAFLGSACVWLLPGASGRVLYLVVLAVIVPLWPAVTGSWSGLAFEVLSYVATSLLLHGLVFTARAAAELERTRTELAGARVLEERLRMSRDLHDAIGGNVVALSLKSELALRHVRAGDTERAREEVAQVLSLTHATGAELRSLVSGFRRPSFAAEVTSARHLLEDAGVRCEIVVDDGPELPLDMDDEAARTVRDAVSHVLQRSDITSVRLSISRGDDGAMVRITHDGADPAPPRPAPGGTTP
ncbi:sensor histidine kinase [Kineococcus arenarius]|uniref:sensor histidine kinase n=1 Tax=unclassified Kineococcus TaxID=2621656 RepID=UPI003D7CBDA0